MQEPMQYVQGQKIGAGLNGEVYNCYADKVSPSGSTQQEQFAIKVFKTACEFKSEEQVLSQLDHPNVIKIIQTEENKMLMKYYENGDLFDFLQKHGKDVITEEVARFFFKQLLTAIQYIHSQNIVHRDIKLENILIDDQFNLILSDFGLSTQVNRGQMLNQYLGTQSYMAPEIVQQNEYCGKSSDIFALGVILFCISVGNYPFQSQALPTDNHYKYFVNKNYIRYWLLVEKQSQKQFSPQFKSLINQMLSYDFNERITIEEIWDHEWMNAGPTASVDEIRVAIDKLQESSTKQQQQEQE